MTAACARPAAFSGWRNPSAEAEEPALAVVTGPAAEGHFEVQPRHVPFVGCAIPYNLDIMGAKQVLGTHVRPMLVLDAAEQGELVVRAEVQLEGADTRQCVVVHPLGILAVVF